MNGRVSSPFVGLVPYTEADARFFFGREVDREIVTANLYAARLTVLYGQSGVGKSSLLHAGVVYQLHRQPGRAIVIFDRWHDDPLPGLKLAIGNEIARVLGSTTPVADEQPFFEYLKESTRGLRVPLLVVLDQFEEYFLYHSPDEGSRSFEAEFARAVNQAECSTNFLISLREEALSKLDIFERRIPVLFDNCLRLEHLDRDAAKEAITGPLERFNEDLPPDQQIHAEHGLASAIVEQVKTGSVTIGQIGRGRFKAGRNEDLSIKSRVQVEAPYLQLVLTRLWNEEIKRGSRVLSLSTLSALGGADRIIRSHLDDGIGRLSPAEQEVSARIFNFLVTPSGTKIALTAVDLSQFAQIPPGPVQAVLDRLAAPNLRILRPVDSGTAALSEHLYEIYHDVLAPAILDWRARYFSRSPISRTLITVLLASFIIVTAQFFYQPSTEVTLFGILVGLVRAIILIVVNTAALLQVYRWFYRYVSLTAPYFSPFAFGGPNAAALLGILLPLLWYVYTVWPSDIKAINAINALVLIDPPRYFALLLTVMTTLLVGLVTFALMRVAGQVTHRLFKTFDLGFFGLYFGVCILVALLIILDLLGVAVDLLPITLLPVGN